MSSSEITGTYTHEREDSSSSFISTGEGNDSGVTEKAIDGFIPNAAEYIDHLFIDFDTWLGEYVTNLKSHITDLGIIDKRLTRLWETLLLDIPDNPSSNTRVIAAIALQRIDDAKKQACGDKYFKSKPFLKQNDINLLVDIEENTKYVGTLTALVKNNNSTPNFISTAIVDKNRHIHEKEEIDSLTAAINACVSKTYNIIPTDTPDYEKIIKAASQKLLSYKDDIATSFREDSFDEVINIIQSQSNFNCWPHKLNPIQIFAQAALFEALTEQGKIDILEQNGELKQASQKVQWNEDTKRKSPSGFVGRVNAHSRKPLQLGL